VHHAAEQLGFRVHNDTSCRLDRGLSAASIM
jgi:hypothetical protein